MSRVIDSLWAWRSRAGAGLSGSLILGCVLALAAVVSPQSARAQGLIGQVFLQKIVSPDPLGIGSTMVFTMTQTCTDDSSGAQHVTSVTVPGDNNPPKTILLPAGNHCTLVEAALPTLPKPCSWVHLGSPTLTPNPAGTLMKVTNGYQCGQPGTLTVRKFVKPDPLGIGATVSFGMTATCTTPPGTYTLTVQGNSSTSIGVPLGSNCTLNETPPPPPPPTLPVGCHWLPPTYSPHQLTIQAQPRANVVSVTNGYTCGEPATVKVSKIILPPDPLHLIGATPIPMTLTCSNDPLSPHAFSVVGGGPAASVSVTAGSYCTLNEIPPPLPNCSWMGPIYTPAQSGTIPAGTTNVTVTNSYKCNPPPPTRIDLGIVKTGPVHTQPGVVVFTVSVTNVGPAFNMPSGDIKITDVATGSLAVAGVTPSPSGLWTCTGGGPSATCAYTGSGAIAAGQLLGTIKIAYQLFAPGTIKNCATIATTPGSNLNDINPSNDTSCVTGR